jgi:5-methyltetrahydrofolate--homocysteine methyltransferase
MDEALQALYNGVLQGDREAVQEQVRNALAIGLDPQVILADGMIAAMKEVGRLFEEGDYYVPEMMLSASAMQDGLAILKPLLPQVNVRSVGRVLIGTVEGDLHDIGKNLVAMMLEGAGFEIRDLGVDVTPQKFVEAVREGNVDIVAMSALLTTTMVNMQTTIEALIQAGQRQRVKIMIGGAPLTEGYARQIGADGYAPDASRAVTLALALMDERA